MNSKDRVLRLVQLERELRAIDDGRLAALIAELPTETAEWIVTISRGLADDGTVDITALRGSLSRGRLKGVPERVAATISDACLLDCIETLGDRADLPSEDDLRRAAPGLVQRHGRDVTRVMLAAAVVGNAPASAAIIKVLKSDPALATADGSSPTSGPGAVPA